jgi:hypothetical protein
MQGQHLFEYAVIRIVPQVEREEFINVGVVLYCSGKKFLQAKCNPDVERICAFSPKVDIAELQAYLHAFCQICAGHKDGGPIAKLDRAERFRWLTATRSTVVQTSRVHPGLCEDPAIMLERLYEQMVL